MFASVGDCKCFRYDSKNDVVSDITLGNRFESIGVGRKLSLMYPSEELKMPMTAADGLDLPLQMAIRTFEI